MRPNRLAEQIAEDRPLIGAFLSFPSQRLVEFCGLVGFDWVLFDGEHEGVSVESCYEYVTAADAIGIGSVVRAPVNRPDVLLGYADTGVNAIIAPHVNTADEAASLVSSLRFPPLGTRGAASGSRAANYGLTQTPREYFEAVDRHPMPAALLEDVAAYENLEEISRTDGLNIFCLGSGDLAGSMGIPGQSGDPSVQELVNGAAKRLSEQGYTVNMSVANTEGARTAIEVGARMIVVSNSGLLGGAARAFLAACRT